MMTTVRSVVITKTGIAGRLSSCQYNWYEDLKTSEVLMTFRGIFEQLNDDNK